MKITNEYLGIALLVIGVTIPIVGPAENLILQLISGVVGIVVIYIGIHLSNQKEQPK